MGINVKNKFNIGDIVKVNGKEYAVIKIHFEKSIDKEEISYVIENTECGCELVREKDLRFAHILTKKEKKYLEFVLAPFKKERMSISKSKSIFDDEFDYIEIHYQNQNYTIPCCREGKLSYNRMELFKIYTLEELGLFEEE